MIPAHATLAHEMEDTMRKHTIRYYAILSLLLGLWGVSVATGILLFAMTGAA